MLVDQARSVVHAADDDGGDREWKVGGIVRRREAEVVDEHQNE